MPLASSELGEWKEWEARGATVEMEVVVVQGDLGKKAESWFGLCGRLAMTYGFSKTQLVCRPESCRVCFRCMMHFVRGTYVRAKQFIYCAH